MLASICKCSQKLDILEISFKLIFRQIICDVVMKKHFSKKKYKKSVSPNTMYVHLPTVYKITYIPNNFFFQN